MLLESERIVKEYNHLSQTTLVHEGKVMINHPIILL